MLLPSLLTPDVATAHLRRLRPTPEQLAEFRAHLAELLRHLDPTKIERHGETHILDFLRSVTRPAEGGSRYGNVNGKRDLVLHLGDTADSPVGVVLEVKGPKNPGEMLAPDDLNRKAFQQLLLYYLEDRTDEKADDFKRLIITTGYEWYVFDALDFNRLFFRDKTFVKAFRDWKAGAKAATDTAFFYHSIAGKQLAALAGELRVAYVDLRPGLPTKPADLLALYRLFHPAYLLKEPLTGRRDPNTLNQEFYNELLYLVGLKEDKQGGLRRIGRCPVGERQPGSLLENTLSKLHIGQGLQNMPAAERPTYGDTLEAQLEEVALALCLVWVNRLLFLKLLEGQLVRYHDAADAAHFRFLTPVRLADYDDVLNLFFEVLNRPPAERSPEMRAAYPEVPYLNSSLFELSPLESQTFDISGLRNGLGLAPYSGSVLRKAGAPAVPPAKAHTSAAPQWAALPYLLHFLDAYDFATDPTTSHAALPAPGAAGAVPGGSGTAPHRAPPRPLLSAAVLGLVFEKINGYRDGSFYTPGFVTMYMARQTLGRAVLRHFVQAPAFPELAGCQALEDLQDALVPARRARRQEYAAHFNTLTVLDPAVGSGHFLVSALNELLALKGRLGLLLDDEGARLPYTLEVEHDELLVTDADGLPAPYRVGRFEAATGHRTVGPERTRLQKALFREKRALMEHALFGVDLNPNSVRICRLRLWIELLKHAYYKPETDFRELETLPNLDLNVKPGNSLLARYGLEADLSEVFKKNGFTLKEYRAAGHAYFGSRGREEKERLLNYLKQIKERFTTEIGDKDPKRVKLNLYRGQLYNLKNQGVFFPGSAAEESARKVKIGKLQGDFDKLDAEIQAHEQGAIFREAFEWRFEFPEVLDEAGAFRGFDVVMGNPPYGVEFSKEAQKVLTAQFSTLKYRLESYVAFIEQGLRLLSPSGLLAYIIPDTFLNLDFTGSLRQYLLDNAQIQEIFTMPSTVFPDAVVDVALLQVQNTPLTKEPVQIKRFAKRASKFVMDSPDKSFTVDTSLWRKTNLFLLLESHEVEELEQIMSVSKPLSTYAKGISGIKAYQAGKGKPAQTRSDVNEKLYTSSVKPSDEWSPFYEGKHILRYGTTWNNDNWLRYGPWLAEPREPNVFIGEKLLVRKIVGETLLATHTKDNSYCNTLLFLLKLKDESPYNYHFILALINSRVMARIIKLRLEIDASDLFPQIMLSNILDLPIPAATPAEQAAIAALVQQILDAKAADPAADTTAPEAAVDAAVAALYGVALPGAGGAL
ncbi:type IIG restriction enzyme/methyltransferase [Hymenobacter siberiensis]|uniref:type IIG restriction enzyme/methyltransferase n=1 Tax=Hymenobacter siberiensis TaxID=2848396 RepID=UPI001C1DF0BA|nr:TaqI-like C-terminal specificity domain-containing protein [Hymenobacter siberiensis]